MAGLWNWVWWSAAIGLGAAGLGLVVWALAWDRSRGRLRCPRCWYEMGDVPAEDGGGRRCPECGSVARRERSLKRTRRRWRWALAGCLVLLGAEFCRVTPRAMREGWLSVVPTTVLLLAPVDVVGPGLDSRYPPEPKRPEWLQAMHEELDDRLGESPLAGWQDGILGWRVRRAARRLGDESVPAEAQELFERLHGARVELTEASVSLGGLAQAIETQTGIPCRVVGEAAAAPQISLGAGRWTALGLLDAIENSWDGFQRQDMWTIEGDGVVLATEGDLYELPGEWRVACYDLGRGAEWSDRRLGWNCWGPSSPGLVLVDDSYLDLADAIEYVVSPELWVSGGGRASLRRIGRWIVVRAPASVHVRVEAFLSAMESSEREVHLGFGRCFAGDPEKGEAARVAADWVIYDLTALMGADRRRQDAIEAAHMRVAPPEPVYEGSPFATPMHQSDFTLVEYQQRIIDLLTRLVDSQSWYEGGGWIGAYDTVGEHLLIRQTPANHESIKELLAAIASAQGAGPIRSHPNGDWTWRVFDTETLWSRGVGRPATPPFLEDAVLNFESALLSRVDELVDEGSDGRESKEPGFPRGIWSEPGRLVVYGRVADIDRVAAWHQKAGHDDAALFDLIDAEE